MQIHLSPRHLTLTAAIHAYVAEKIGHLEELASSVIGAHVVLLHDDKANPKKAYVVKVHLAVPGPDIHADEAGEDLYAAIDKVTDKLARQLRKRKTRLVEKTRASNQRKAEKRKSG